jgi:hypothetical protein
VPVLFVEVAVMATIVKNAYSSYFFVQKH